MTQPGIEPRSTEPLANTLTIMPITHNHVNLYCDLQESLLNIDQKTPFVIPRKFRGWHNRKKNFGSLRKLAVNQTAMKDYQLQ